MTGVLLKALLGFVLVASKPLVKMKGWGSRQHLHQQMHQAAGFYMILTSVSALDDCKEVMRSEEQTPLLIAVLWSFLWATISSNYREVRILLNRGGEHSKKCGLSYVLLLFWLQEMLK